MNSLYQIQKLLAHFGLILHSAHVQSFILLQTFCGSIAIFLFSETVHIHDFHVYFPPGVHGDSLTVLQAPEFVSFQKGDWPVSGEKIPDLVALTMGFSIQEVH